MHDIPLNDTQRIFADKNHNLVYKFLHEKNLPASEYYDIVIFGYLRAVQRYLTDPNLAGYSFSTVAWRAMEGEVVNTPPAPTSVGFASFASSDPDSLTRGI